MVNKVYEIITDRIIEQLEGGQIPWSQPWTASEMPKNAVSNKQYKGINTILLYGRYKNPSWLTYNQAQTLKGNVKKGEKSTPVIFWSKMTTSDKTDKKTGKTITTKKEYDGPILRYYNVFNVEQCDNLPGALYEVNKQINFKPVDRAEQIVNEYPNKPRIRHDYLKAYYSPGGDFVNMPNQNTFKSIESYYSVLFHELVHSTGHESRLNRLSKNASFGNAEYSIEELIAEIGAAFLRSECNINVEDEMTRSAAYIQSWISVLKNDKTMIVKAAGKSQKAADHILNKMVVS